MVALTAGAVACAFAGDAAGLQRGFSHMNSGQEGQDPYAEKFLKD